MLKQQRFKVKGPIIEVKKTSKIYEPMFGRELSLPRSERSIEYKLYKNDKEIGKTEVALTDKDVVERQEGHYLSRVPKGFAESNAIEIYDERNRGKGYGSVLSSYVERDLKKEGATRYNITTVGNPEYAKKKGFKRIRPGVNTWTKEFY